VRPEVGPARARLVRGDGNVGDHVVEHAEAVKLGGRVQAGRHLTPDAQPGRREPQPRARSTRRDAVSAGEHARPAAGANQRPQLAAAVAAHGLRSGERAVLGGGDVAKRLAHPSSVSPRPEEITEPS
jgi:hypothetical protein